MALTHKLREDIRKRLGIEQAAYYNRIRQKFSESGAPSMDIAGLLLAQELGIDVTRPRYGISPKQIQALQEHQSRQVRTIITVPAGNSPKAKKKLAQKNVPFKHLLTFQSKYPDVFFERLEREINMAYSNPELPNAVVMLSRKLIENLLFRVIQFRFRGKDISLYFDTDHNRSQDFSILLNNLKIRKKDFPQDLHHTIDKFLSYAGSFRLKANANTHEIS